ncbi:helix-turn-helix domain-containing protein [Clostridium perfringens]|uniref:helix-turn-helix domain-containing protein n=1 Tax=Clostridium perfringens TaxID=1502 RepID=UPI0013E2E681|nr:helix-turn-helix transcriptional regulator [Clostridium perfringens]NGT04246.1 helix-turn-helix transcriptional regulator [Clostridium perfringens]
MSESSTTLGEKIRKYRKANGLTMKELGKKLDLSEQAISQYERNKREPNLKTLKKLSSALDVPISEFYKDEFKELSKQLINNEKEINSSLYKASQWDSSNLFALIVTYMKNVKKFKTVLDFSFLDEITEEDVKIDHNLITTTEINEIINKVCEVVEFEIYKLEKKKNNKNKISKDNNITPLPKKEKQIWEEEGKEYLMPKASHDKEGDFTEEDYKHDDDLMNDEDLWK